MTAYIDSAQFATSLSASRRTTAAMWRGAMLDRFAALEDVARQGIVDLSMPGTASLKKGDVVAWKRFAHLSQILRNTRFVPLNGNTLALLAQLEQEHELRIGLAHGRLHAGSGTIELKWHAPDGNGWEPKSLLLSWSRALEALHRIDKLSRDLSSQLGQLRKIHRQTLSQ